MAVFPWLRLYGNRRILIVSLLGFMSGLPLLLTGSTLSVWLVEGGVSRTSVGLFALVGFPYAVKFLWAPFIDQVRVPGLGGRLGHRRSWLLVTQVGLVFSVAALGFFDPSQHLSAIALACLAVAFFSASQDVVIDAYRIELLREYEQGAGAAVLVAGYRGGMLVSGAGALYLASALSWAAVYVIMAGCVAVGMAVLCLLPAGEPPYEPPAGSDVPGSGWLSRYVTGPLIDLLRRPGSFSVLVFITLYKLGDVYAGTMSMPFFLDVGFEKAQVASVVKVFGLFAALGGGAAGGLMVAQLGILRSLVLCGFLQMLSNLLFVLLVVSGPELRVLGLVIAVENATAGMGTAAFVAYLSSLCDRRVSATQYALLSSFTALGRDVFAASSGWFADHLGWSVYFSLSSALALPGVLVVLGMYVSQRRNPSHLPRARP